MRSAGRDFVENTKYQNLRESEGERDPVHPPFQAEWPADAPLVELSEPAPTMPQAADFLRLAEGRSSVRRYRPEPLSQAELAYLLYATQVIDS